MNHVSLNGKITGDSTPVFMSDNRSYRYGDGLFETMKVFNEKIILENYHFDRLFSGLKLLHFTVPDFFTAERLREQIILLCKKNKCDKLGRVRLSVSRGNGNLNDDGIQLEYLIECWPLNEAVNRLNETGLIIDIYPDARKSCDTFSNLKSSNYLPYVMASLYAADHNLNDCIVLNSKNKIADSTIANIFLVKSEVLITPALSEGCVNGVMRKYLKQKTQEMGYRLNEQSIDVHDLEHADEVFLTNAIHGMAWVKQFCEKEYGSLFCKNIFQSTILPLYH